MSAIGLEGPKHNRLFCIDRILREVFYDKMEDFIGIVEKSLHFWDLGYDCISNKRIVPNKIL